MVYQRIQRLSLAEHGESRTGDLLTRVTSDIDAVQDFITSALLGHRHQPADAGRHARRHVLHELALHADRAVGRAGDVPGRLLLHEADQEGVARLVKKREGELMSGVAEVLTSIQVVQAFAREDYEDRRFDWESRQNVAAGLRARSMKARLSPMVDMLVAVGTCLVLGYGARLVMAGDAQHRAADHLHLLSGQDLQADEATCRR